MSLSQCRAEAIRNSRGFTLIETLIATGITLTALVSVAAMFAYSARTNILTEQRTTGILLATSKLEGLRSTSSISTLTVGGGIDASSPTTSYFEYVTIGTSGAITTSTTAGANPYLRMWQISGTNPRLITVSVYANNSGVTGGQTELIRTATTLTNGF